MSDIRIANAPCSWGALEFEGLAGERIGYSQMLDELRETGYTGTELGDWGFMPSEPAALSAELERRELAMVGAFVPVALKHAAAHAGGEADALKTARLLAAVADARGHAAADHAGRRERHRPGAHAQRRPGDARDGPERGRVADLRPGRRADRPRCA